MKENFDKCLDKVLEHEGGYVNHPDDPGGRTNMGITQDTYESYLGRDVSEQEMKDMPKLDVAAIYKKMYWDKVKGDLLSDGVDFCVFDWSVNSGVARAIIALQNVVGAKPDGLIGPNTLKAVNNADSQIIITQLSEAREDFYKRLAAFDTFGKGWLNRNNKTRDFSLNLTGMA